MSDQIKGKSVHEPSEPQEDTVSQEGVLNTPKSMAIIAGRFATLKVSLLIRSTSDSISNSEESSQKIVAPVDNVQTLVEQYKLAAKAPIDVKCVDGTTTSARVFTVSNQLEAEALAKLLMDPEFQISGQPPVMICNGPDTAEDNNASAPTTAGTEREPANRTPVQMVMDKIYPGISPSGKNDVLLTTETLNIIRQMKNLTVDPNVTVKEPVKRDKSMSYAQKLCMRKN